MEVDLTGRVAVVTGSTRGIGFGIAVGLARAGADVVVNGRRPESTRQAADTIREQVEGARILPAVADLGTPEGIDFIRATAPEADIVVNNLGIYEARPALEISDEEWRHYFEVNVMSAIRMIRQYLPGMMERQWGRVLTITSDSSVVTPGEMIHYGVTKTALLAVTRGFAKAAAGTGVTVNSVMAGPTHTSGVETFVGQVVGADLPWDTAQHRFMREYRPTSLIQRFIEPEEIANLVVYLSSDLASATTGGTLRVDGGYVDAIIP
jgi:NAD(P)-dependent dehydrogenase (short-subunit alcohol dehydrogenase family)